MFLLNFDAHVANTNLALSMRVVRGAVWAEEGAVLILSEFAIVIYFPNSQIPATRVLKRQALLASTKFLNQFVSLRPQL